MQHAYPVHQEISDEILPMHYGRTFTRERKKRVKPAQLSSIRDLTQLNVLGFPGPCSLCRPHHGKTLNKKHVSNEKNLGWLGYIGDYTTQLYREYNNPL